MKDKKVGLAKLSPSPGKILVKLTIEEYVDLMSSLFIYTALRFLDSEPRPLKSQPFSLFSLTFDKRKGLSAFLVLIQTNY